jgi:predicted RNA binding protein YcfA (HicA-like mRNA interferase family)
MKVGTELQGTVPNWGSKDLKPGTMRKILRELQIDRRDFDQA